MITEHINDTFYELILKGILCGNAVCFLDNNTRVTVRIQNHRSHRHCHTITCHYTIDKDGDVSVYDFQQCVWYNHQKLDDVIQSIRRKCFGKYRFAHK